MDDNVYLDINVNAITRELGMGSSGSSLSNAIKGKNWLGGTTQAPKNDDNLGLLFCTRPDLNLSYDNIGVNRELHSLLTNDPNTLPYIVKMWLDPRQCDRVGKTSHSVDPDYPFLPLIDNTITECSGWPDYVLEKKVSQPGKYGQQISVPKGTIQKYSEFPLTTTHQNIKGDAVGLLLSTYLHYMHNTLVTGTMSPHKVNVARNLRDYQVRFYRLVLNTLGTHVTQFTMTTATYPMTLPTGAIFNYSTEKPVNEGYDQYSVQWSAMHCWHNDPLVIREFNRTVYTRNVMMTSKNRALFYKEVPPPYLKYFTFNGYPLIDPDTFEFQVWVPKDVYIETLLSLNIKPDIEPDDIGRDTVGDIFWK